MKNFKSQIEKKTHKEKCKILISLENEEDENPTKLLQDKIRIVHDLILKDNNPTK